MTLPALAGLSSRPLRPSSRADLAQLERLCSVCDDYHQLVYGGPAAPDEALRILSELPPGKAPADKEVFGLFAEGWLAGVLDLVRDFREPGEWYLGTLLIAPTLRRQGHGSRVLAAAVEAVQQEGAKALRLACAEQNEGGLRFWRREGFCDARRFPPRTMGGRQTVLLELTRRL